MILGQLGTQTSTGEEQWEDQLEGGGGQLPKAAGSPAACCCLGEGRHHYCNPWSWSGGWQGRVAGIPESTCDVPRFPIRRLSPRPICCPQAASKSLGSPHLSVLPCPLQPSWGPGETQWTGCQERQSAELQRLGKGEGPVGPMGGPPQVQGDPERGQALAHFERLWGQASLQLSSLLWAQQHPRTHHDPCSLRPAKREKEPSLSPHYLTASLF